MGRIRTILIIAGLLFSTSGFASHILGGEITWQCLGSGQYEFTLKLYRDCTGGALPTYAQTINGPQGGISVNFVGKTDFSPTCYDAAQAYGCPPVVVYPNIKPGSVEEYVYRGTTSLTGTPAGTGWEFSWTLCCRPTVAQGGTLRNTNTGGYYIRSKMYPYTPPGATAPLSANQCYDNSPYFVEPPLSLLCKGSKFSYIQLAGDKEVDSLYYEWADPLQSAATPIVWTSGYSSTAPFPDQGESALNGPVVLDNVSGEVTTEIHALPLNTLGTFASCIKVEAWKDCQLKAEIFRDVAIIVEESCSPNTKPTLSIDLAQYPFLTKTGNVYKTQVYPGDNVHFEMTSFDPDFNDLGGGVLVPQKIEFKAGGLMVSADPAPLSSSTGCDGEQPCATLVPKAPQATYSNSLNNRVIFDWTPDCQHLATPAACGAISSVYRFAFRMEDNGCAVPAVEVATLLIEVLPGDPSPVRPSCLNPDGNGNIHLQWEKAKIDSALAFNYYMILGAPTLAGTYDTLQRIYDIDSLGTIINGTNYKHFYMIKSTGKCDFLSFPSDTISFMEMSLTATPPGNAEFANLTWTPMATPLSDRTLGVYEIWSEAPAGSGNWVKMGETTGTTYVDEVTVCNALVNYQIRVTDTAKGCQSGSTIDSARFTDQTNKDQFVLDSVSVNDNGNSIISWSPTQYGDVVNYYLYFNDSKLGWIVVDTIPVGATMPHEWTGSDADSRSEQFRVVSVDSCQNQSDAQVVVPHRTIYMRQYIDKCEAVSHVSWNNYEGFGKSGVREYRLQVQVDGGPWNLLFVGSPEDTTFTQRNLQNGSRYCYRVQVTDTSGTRTSTSNERCELAEVPRKSRILYLAQVTNDLNRGALDLNFLVDGQADVESFTIERALDKRGPYRNIGTVGKPRTAPYLINFADYDTDPSSYHYFYRVSATDSCGGRDTISNIGRNILLEVEPRSNLTNLLTWNPYEDWDGIVATYHIFRKAAEEPTFELVGNVQGTDTTFVDNIADYGNTEGNFCYYVEAMEGNNSLGIVTPAGLPYNSTSNQVCMNQQVRAFMPSAFRPGSDIMANREFGPSLRFTDVEGYHFYVMNRWGVKIFETDNPEEKWDGTHAGEAAAQGVYIYYVRYSTPGDHSVEDRGSFTLIR